MPGPDMFSVLRKRLLLRGFIVSDFAAKQGDFLRDVGEWVRTVAACFRITLMLSYCGLIAVTSAGVSVNAAFSESAVSQ